MRGHGFAAQFLQRIHGNAAALGGGNPFRCSAGRGDGGDGRNSLRDRRPANRFFI
jgi:hypothetical protein